MTKDKSEKMKVKHHEMQMLRECRKIAMFCHCTEHVTPGNFVTPRLSKFFKMIY